jgi:hypothetical protein
MVSAWSGNTSTTARFANQSSATKDKSQDKTCVSEGAGEDRNVKIPTYTSDHNVLNKLISLIGASSYSHRKLDKSQSKTVAILT